MLLDVRVELHRRTGKAGDRLLLQEQDGVAAALGYADADALMAEVAAAARTIAWTSDETWRRIALVARGARAAGRRRPTATSARALVLRDGEVDADRRRRPGRRPDAGRCGPAAAAAEAGAAPVAGRPLDRLAAEAAAAAATRGRRRPATRLRRAARRRAGRHRRSSRRSTSGACWTRLLPGVGGGPQPARSATPTTASPSTGTCARRPPRPPRWPAGCAGPTCCSSARCSTTSARATPATTPRSASSSSARSAPAWASRPTTSTCSSTLVRHHLLLPDVATRRDLDDRPRSRRWPTRSATRRRLELLAALTEADSLATGPAAWGAWKAGLVARAGRAHRPGAGRPARRRTAAEPLPDGTVELIARARLAEALVLDGEGPRRDRRGPRPARPVLPGGGDAGPPRPRRGLGPGLVRATTAWPSSASGSRASSAADPTGRRWSRTSTGSWPARCRSRPGWPTGPATTPPAPARRRPHRPGSR